LAAERRAAREESGEKRFLGEHKIARGLLAVLILVVAAAGVVVMSEHFADSVKEMVETNAGLRDYEFFLGLILIPVLAGVVELYGSVGMARRKKMDITMAITAGASIQMILLVVPILVLVGWFTGHPLGLVFTPLNVIIFGAATFAFMLLSRDGESTMLEGVQLVALWLLLAVIAIYLPPNIIGG
jgi:Ca2+:H+ antiporter